MPPPTTICFEGPSGIGKTTLAQSLRESFRVIPEVNLLFRRPGDASEYWYHERQVERIKIARTADQPAIFDGDPFQPVWYNWACGYPAEFLPREATHAFYRRQLAAGTLAFPDLYVHFHVEEAELWQRKENDATRQRRNFEKHLRIIAPLRRYFEFVERETPLEVQRVHFKSLDHARREVTSAIGSLETHPRDHLAIFDQIDAWIRHTNP